MDGETYVHHWDNESQHGAPSVVLSEEVICTVEPTTYPTMTGEGITIAEDTDQTAAENLMYLAQDVAYTEDTEFVEERDVECVTEEVITDDWVTPGGQERVEVPLDQLNNPTIDIKEENDTDVLLPTDQDEYTAMRPWPCDFCSRRFRKKAALMNHMVAHQTDRPHSCNLCGVQYVRKNDLMHHLKVHAFVPDHPDSVECDDLLDGPLIPRKKRGRRKKNVDPLEDDYSDVGFWPCDYCPRRFHNKSVLMNHLEEHHNDQLHGCNICGTQYERKSQLMSHLKVHSFVSENPDSIDYDDLLENYQVVKKKKRGRQPKNREPIENGIWEHMTSARTQQWSRRTRKPSVTPPSPPSPPSAPTPPPPPPPIPADPRRPFVCVHCGVGFAREKALKSHSRIHGGDSPLECSACGELCWSREALSSHTRSRHPHLPSPAPRYREPSFQDSNSGDDMDYAISLSQDERSSYDDSTRGPELFCQDCGVAFQRADLLRRHVIAAHSYKRHDSEGAASENSLWPEHRCDVCGETCTDALQLLAHAEGHARNHTTPRLKKLGRTRNTTSSSSSARQFPCRECGKTFGSRSSQQIHIRIHTGERPYACRFCWKAFADGGTLRKHERIHTGEKPYACAVCPRAFNQRVVLREHVRSHHSVRSSGGPAYSCVVCGRTLPSSTELVVHLIQHCDANTALKRQPQSGPRKYKRRRKIKQDPNPPPRENEWDEPSISPPSSPRPRAKRRRTVTPQAPPSRPRMIHTGDARPRTKTVRARRPPRHPADDLRAIMPIREPEIPSVVSPKLEPDEDGPFTCQMCSLNFDRRDALLLHVPIHI